MLHQSKSSQRSWSVVLLTAAALLTGCALDSSGNRSNSQVSWLDASSSMRVEVEVYKGPLSKEPAIQFSELMAVAEDAERALQVLYANMTVSATRLGCTSAPETIMCIRDGKTPDCEIDKQIEQQPSSAIRDPGQSTTNLYYDTQTIQRPAQRGDYSITIPEERIDEEDRFIFCNTLAQLLIDRSERNARLQPK